MSGVLGSLSLITSVTVRPPPTSEVPLSGALATVAPLRSSRVTVRLASVSTVYGRSVVALETLPASSALVTVAMTLLFAARLLLLTSMLKPRLPLAS